MKSTQYRIAQQALLTLTLSLSTAFGFSAHAAEQNGVIDMSATYAMTAAREDYYSPMYSQPTAVEKDKALTVRQRSANASKRLAKKILIPIHATLIELGHPIEFLKTAQRRLWPSTIDRLSDDDNVHSYRIDHSFDIGLNQAPSYSLTSKRPSTTSTRTSLYRYVMPVSYEMPDSVTSPVSTTQLKVRVRGDWSMLYEVAHTGSVTSSEDIGVGLGLRYAF